MSSAGLSARLARLEASRERETITAAYLITCVTHFAEPGEVLAARSPCGQIVARNAGEPLDAFTLRAGKAVGQRVLIALYADDYQRAHGLASR